MTMIEPSFVSSSLASLYQDAKCTLNFSSPFQCVIAVSLSAQTTDEKVNEVTPALFKRFPTPESLSLALPSEVEPYIKSLGLYRNKAANLVGMAKALVQRYSGEVPNTLEQLTSLPGVGVKTASVVLAECFNVPAFPVDTHISRISKRLGYAKVSDSPEAIMGKLKKRFKKDEWVKLHHRLIAFGRAICHAQNPECGICPFSGKGCKYQSKCSMTKGK